jgi:hypothetical protein
MRSSLSFKEAPNVPDTRTGKELLQFEHASGILLPPDYKEFCQIFGAGQFGDYIRIFCPNIDESISRLQFVRENLEETDLDEYSDVGLSVDLVKVRRIVDRAYIFGDNPNSQVLLWDLESYSTIDKSYDIYLISNNYPANAYGIGRNFFKFVSDFCIGQKSYELLPEILQAYPEEIYSGFLQFSKPLGLENQELSEKPNQIWRQNSESGVVLQLAYQYEIQENFLEALLLYLNYMQMIDHEHVEAMRLANAFRRIYKAIGDSRFHQICNTVNNEINLIQEVNFFCSFGYRSLETTIPNERYPNFQSYIKRPQALEIERMILPNLVEQTQSNPSLLDEILPKSIPELQNFRNVYLNFQSQLENFETLGQLAVSETIESPKNINSLLDEAIPEPDAEFQSFWQDYLESIYARLNE